MARRWLDPRERLRPRPARSRGDRARARRGLARPGQRRRAARRAALARLPDRRGGAARRRLGRLARSAGAREARRAARRAAGEPLDRGRAAGPVPRAVAGRAGSTRRSPPPADRRGKAWTPRAGAGRDPARPARGSRAGHARRWPRRSGSSRSGDRARWPRSKPRAAILRGRFPPGVNDEQWCDRRLLARIHHYTVKRLRAEIEPVAARDFLRFLFAWQHVADDARMEGPDALAGGPSVARRLRGAGRGLGDGDPAGAAQGLRAVLARRRMPRRADRLGAAEPRARRRRRPRAAGSPGARDADHPARTGARSPLWTSLAPPPTRRLRASPRAQGVLDCLAAHGALVLRRDRRGDAPSARAGRGGARPNWSRSGS